MAEKIPTRKRPNRRAIAGLSLTAILLVLGWYVNSHGFRERVRLAVIAKLQQVTGGEVELKSLNPEHPDYSFDLTEVAWIHRIVWASQ